MDQLPTKQPKRFLPAAALLICALLLLLLAYLERQDGSPGKQTDLELVVYAFSTQEEVLSQGIFPAFTRHWQSSHDTRLTISGMFGPSGTLAGQISLGAPADVAILSNANQLNYLIISRTVDQKVEPVHFGASPIVIVTRPGNPSAITGFEDLTRDGLVLIQADPRSSGLGEWSLLAEYGSTYLQSGDQGAALEETRLIWQNVRLIAPSARSALTLFELGAGDALITYEQDALLALDQGAALDVILPAPTILAEPVAVGIDRNISRSEKEAAEEFLAFLTSPEAQAIFASYYLRTGSTQDPGIFTPGDTFTPADLGGWADAYSQLIKPFWEEHILPALSLEDQPALIAPDN